MTVAEELANRRNCRYKLAGVLVAVDGVGEPVPVAHTHWNEHSKLIVTLQDGRDLAPERCHLRSFWPVACCRPGRWNPWNRRPK